MRREGMEGGGGGTAFAKRSNASAAAVVTQDTLVRVEQC